jgi:predicted dehydrogenase
MTEFRVLIIGAGKIGAFFDSPGDEAVLSHGHSFSRHPGFSLLGFVDTDPIKARKAALVWGGEAFESLDTAFRHHNVDVAVVAVPDEFHGQILHQLVKYQLKCVLAEKPLAQSLHESEKITELYKEKHIPLAVNYIRRFVPEFIELRGRIASCEFGAFLGGSGYYGKGTMHNGSHLVDLIRYLLGEVTAVTPIGCILDWNENDPTCSAVLGLSCGGKIIVQAVDCRNFTIFELDLFFAEKRVRIVDSGFTVELCDTHDSGLYAGYRTLSAPLTQDTHLSIALYTVAEAIFNFLMEGKTLPCGADDGVKAIEICTRMMGVQ